MKYLAFILLVFSGISQAQTITRDDGWGEEEFLEGKTVTDSLGKEFTCYFQELKEAQQKLSAAESQSSEAKRKVEEANQKHSEAERKVEEASQNKWEAEKAIPNMAQMRCLDIYDYECQREKNRRQAAYDEALAAYDEASAAFDKAQAAENKAWNASRKAYDALDEPYETESNLIDTVSKLKQYCWARIKYERGNWSCNSLDLLVAWRDSKDVDTRAEYYKCVVIQGKDSEGLPELYLLADQPGGWGQNSIYARYFLANYLRTDGKLDGSTAPNKIDEALKYYFAVWAQAKLEQDSDNDFYELQAAYYVPRLYVFKHNHHVFSLDYSNLDEVIRYADECANLPNKTGVEPERYQATITSCRLMKDTALKLKPLDEKRVETLTQPHCEAVREAVSEDYPDNPNCPEYDEIHKEIHSLQEDLSSAINDAWDY